jgi:hypothetical protein
MCEVSNTALATRDESSEPAVNPDEAAGEPVETAVAKLAKSEVKAAIAAMASPAFCVLVDVIETSVWLATLSIAPNNEFHCAAVIVLPADTVDIVD